jgi:pyrroloquinoline quinone (PQQ) biosynthesis protein C
MMPSATGALTIVELEREKLKFEGDSGKFVITAACIADGTRSLKEIADQTGFSEEFVAAHVFFLKEAGVILDLCDYRVACAGETALERLRSAARFYNARVTANECIRTVLSGQGSRALVLGFAIEFYFYVASVARYMTAGIARFEHDAETMAPFWKHFAEEAGHSEIFRRGLICAGIDNERLKQNCAIATTQALISFLYERASRTLIEYGVLFAIMQPKWTSNVNESARGQKYGILRTAYPFAEPIWDAFETHEKIDEGADHQRWAVESYIQKRGVLSAEEMSLCLNTMRDASCFFILFLDGIRFHYRGDAAVMWRPLNTVIGEDISGSCT